MMSGKDGVGQIIKACVTVVTLIALTGRFGIIKTTLDDLVGLTRWAGDTIWPAQLTDGLMGICLRWDNWVSVRYAEELNSGKSSVLLQRADRHGILGQKPADLQRHS